VPLGEVIAVLSGKGGTGKTSLCAAVAAALAESGKRVLCIDCDVGLRNLDISLGIAEAGALSFLDVSEGGYSLDLAERHPVYPTVYFLTAPMNCPVEKIDTLRFAEMLRTARKFYDYIFLDTPAGVDAGFRLTAVPADRFLLVTGAGPAAVRDAARVGELLEIMGKKDIRLIVNRVDKEMLSTIRLTIDDVMDNAGLPLIGIVPEDPNVILAASFGKPLLAFAKRTPAAKACRAIAKRIQGFHEPITLR
jgi:septum site-determining protein MinD